MTMSPQEAFLSACWLDVAVQKPGNVSLLSPGHGMQAAMFVASAQAAAPALFARGASVGARIEAATRASWAAAGCNTNLGIVLLCAPLAAALEGQPLAEVLDSLTLADSQAAYRAIRLANPGGLGQADAQDVHDAPSLPLRAAMALAADRDSIARQYANAFADVRAAALAHPPPVAGPPAPGQTPDADTQAWVQRVYLHWLAQGPDSHIVRKHGQAVAQTVMHAAQGWLAQAQAGAVLQEHPAFFAWDQALKQRAINPGTSADLTVATLWRCGQRP